MANDGKDGPSDLVREAMEREGVMADNVVPIKSRKGKRGLGKKRPKAEAKLTQKMIDFCHYLVDGKGMDQSSAYRAAYNAENMADKSVWSEASKLFAHPLVSQRIDELRAAREQVAVHSGASLRSMLIEKLADIIKNPESQQVQVRAIHELGSTGLVNLFTSDGDAKPDMTDDEVLAELETKLKAAFPATG